MMLMIKLFGSVVYTWISTTAGDLPGIMIFTRNGAVGRLCERDRGGLVLKESCKGEEKELLKLKKKKKRVK